MVDAEAVAEGDALEQLAEERAARRVGDRRRPLRVEEAQRVAAAAVLHHQVVLGRRDDARVQPHDVGMADRPVVLRLAAQQLLRTRVDAVALDHLDSDHVAGRVGPGEAHLAEGALAEHLPRSSGLETQKRARWGV